jgi:hypothetical protein
MAIVVPSPESAKNLPVALSEKQLIVAETLTCMPWPIG